MQQLFRSSAFTATLNQCRKKTLYRSMKREFRRLKTINTLSPEFTGEQSVHGWLDTKKLRALGKIYEEQRNKHALTMKLEQKDILDYNKFYREIADLEYLQAQQNKYWLQKFEGVFDNCMNEIETLPFYLKEEIKNLSKMDEDAQASRLENFTLYYDQIMRTYPEEEAQNLLLGYRLQKIAIDKLPQGD